MVATILQVSSLLGLALLLPGITRCAPLHLAQTSAEELDSFLEGDIINLVPHMAELSKPHGRNLVSSRDSLWPNKTLTYELSQEFHPMEKMWIQLAIQSLQNETCVRFVQRTTENDYMFVRNKVGCASPVGFHHGRVEMFLMLPGCIRWGTIQHEFLHALGFWHEHSRPDRDQHVVIQWHNIARGLEVNFAARSLHESQLAGLPYDFGSVMHYRAVAFSRDNSSPTIIPLQEGVTIGQRDKFSQADLAKLNRLYECGPQFYRGDDLALATLAQSTEPHHLEATTTSSTSVSPPSTSNSSARESSSPTTQLPTTSFNKMKIDKNSESRVKLESKEFATNNALIKNEKYKNNLIIKKILRKKRQDYFPRRDGSIDLRPPPAPIPHYWHNPQANPHPEPRPTICPCRDNNPRNNPHNHDHRDPTVDCSDGRPPRGPNKRPAAADYDRRPRNDRDNAKARGQKPGVVHAGNGTAPVSRRDPGGDFESGGGGGNHTSAESYDYWEREGEGRASSDPATNATQYGPPTMQRSNHQHNAQPATKHFKSRGLAHLT